MRYSGKIMAVLLVTAFVAWGGVAQEVDENLSSGRSFGLGATLSSPPVVSGILCLSDETCLEVTAGFWSGVVVANGAFQYRIIDGPTLDFLPFVSGGYWGVSYGGQFLGGPILGAGGIAEYSFTRELVVRASVGVTYVAADFVGITYASAVSMTYGLSVHFYFGQE